MLLVKFKQTQTITNHPNGTIKTGISSVDTILQNNNAIYAKQLIDGMPNMDMAVAADPEVGLDKVYILYFKQSQDVLLAMFDLNGDSNIEKATPNQYMDSTITLPNDTFANRANVTTDRQALYLDAIKAYDGWDITTGSSDITIAVVDTGVDDTHEDLTGRVIQNRSFYNGTCYNFGWAYSCIQTRENSRPQTTGHWHGTAVAGILGATANNSRGIAGLNWGSRILAINAFNDALESDGAPRTNDALVGTGIIEATNRGAKVINLSLGGYGNEYIRLYPLGRTVIIHSHPTELGAVKYAYKKKVTVIVAAGNDKREISGYPGVWSFQGSFPASFPEVISVSGLRVNSDRSIGLYDGLENITNTGNDGTNFGKVEISAPAQFILYPNLISHEYATHRGTSFAAPMVSALAGLLLSLDSNKRPDHVLSLLCDHATKVTINSDATINRKYIGCGMINVNASLSYLFSQLPTPTITNECDAGFPFPDNTCIAGRWFEQFSYQFNAVSGTPPFKWSAEGGLPSNTRLNADTGTLCCGPTNSSGYGWNFDVIVTDSKGKKDRKSFYFQSGL